MIGRRSIARWVATILALISVVTSVASCGGAGAPVTPPQVTAQTAQTPAAGERTVKHAMGETKVPAVVRRVVVLDTGELDSALALGIKPVGSVTGREGSAFPVYLGGTIDGIQDVGTYTQPNLEAIAALKPDLILSSKLRHEAIYGQLSQIAPTVFTESVGASWKANFLLHAEALGKSAEARRLLDDYDRRTREFKGRMGDRLGSTRVSVVRSLSDHVRIMMKASFIGTVLEDAGLPRPAAQDKAKFSEDVKTKEGIPQMDGDVIFMMQFNPEKGSLLKEWLHDPLWQQLGAVQRGAVYEVSDDVWARGIGILGANKVLDDLFKHLAGGAAAGPRVVKHALGETKAPANPQRVVVLDMSELDIALSLGVKPVGYATYTADEELAPYLKERIGGSTRVGTVQQPNLEAILALKPDLILTNKLRHEAIYGQLSQIAPTVVAETVRGDWKNSLRLHAEALGKTAEAEQLMARYQQRLEEFKRAMGPRLAETKVSLVRSFPDHVRIYMKDSFMGTVVADAGLGRPAAQDKQIFMEQANEERIPDLDGDVMFSMYWNREKGEQLTKLKNHPLWSRLDVVKQGRVYEVDDRVWGTGLGPLAANLIIDDLFKYLVERR